MGKKLTKSKTFIANIVFTVLQAANGGLALFQPVVDPTQFASISMVIGMAHGAVGVYLRTVTSEPITK